MNKCRILVLIVAMICFLAACSNNIISSIDTNGDNKPHTLQEVLNCVRIEEDENHYLEYIPIGDTGLRFDESDLKYLDVVLEDDAMIEKIDMDMYNIDESTIFAHEIYSSIDYAVENDKDGFCQLESCIMVSDSYINNCYEYFYALYKPQDLGTYVIYYVYEIDNNREFIGIWGSAKNCITDSNSIMSYEDLASINLEDIRINDLLKSGAILDFAHSMHIDGYLFLEDGTSAYIGVKLFGFEDGRENDNYLICTYKNITKVSVSDIVLSEHLPVKLLTQ